MARNGHSGKRAKGALFHYRTYSFRFKDPVIDRLRTMVQDAGLSYGEVHVISGVSVSCLSNWFEGETKKPQYATVAAVSSSLGYEQQFVKAKEIDFKKEIEVAAKWIEQRRKEAQEAPAREAKAKPDRNTGPGTKRKWTGKAWEKTSG